jgi:hypothetical protein
VRSSAVEWPLGAENTPIVTPTNQACRTQYNWRPWPAVRQYKQYSRKVLPLVTHKELFSTEEGIFVSRFGFNVLQADAITLLRDARNERCLNALLAPL